ncbi:MAG: hypothetical protein JWO20_2521 [Candidatus Angelobacter sp.]|jgi:hypothetical protein|nr:hypothetical protein [Candidatus Angelobacter sp.]
MRCLQTAALLIAVIAIVFLALTPSLDDPFVILKGHQAQFRSQIQKVITGLSLAASQQTSLQLFAIITHRYRFSSPHNQDLMDLTCVRLC